MFLLRKIGSVLRGKATPFQVLLATILGGMLGFVPGFFLPGDLGGGFLQAPGLILGLLCLALVLNANLGVFGLVTLVAKALSMPLLWLSYWLGTVLLDSFDGLFRSLIQGKVTAWFGLEYYATTGGLVVGLGFGLASGLVLNKVIRTIRSRMASVEESSETYQKFAKKGWVRLLAWVLLGSGKGKQSWQELSQKKVGLPIRITGVLLAAVLVASVYVFQTWFSAPILTHNTRQLLQAMNGATVDLQVAELDLSSAQLQVKQLAMADSTRLDKDLLAADALVGIVDTGELLRRRLVIDELRATNARAGTKRSAPGEKFPDPTPEPEPPVVEGGTTIDDWLAEYEVWKQRLEQAREWIEAIAGGDEPIAEPTPAEVETTREAEAQSLGFARVVAHHLLDDQPRFEIRRIDIEDIQYEGQKYALRGRSLSTAPSLLATPPSFGLFAADGTLTFDVRGRSRTEPALGFSLAMQGIPVDSLFGKLKLGGKPPLRGGTMDLASTGTFTQAKGQALSMDLPIQVALRDTLFALAGTTETKVENLVLPTGLRGPFTRPSVFLDDQSLQQALVQAGKQELANFVQGQAGKLLGGVAGKLPSQLQGLVDPNKSPEQMAADAKAKAEAEAKRLQDEAAAKLEAEKKKAEEELKKKAEEELKKRLPGGLPGGLPTLPGFGGGKKD